MLRSANPGNVSRYPGDPAPASAVFLKGLSWRKKLDERRSDVGFFGPPSALSLAVSPVEFAAERARPIPMQWEGQRYVSTVVRECACGGLHANASRHRPIRPMAAAASAALELVAELLRGSVGGIALDDAPAGVSGVEDADGKG